MMQTGELLTGVKVLDMGRVAAGPHCALLLASVGADVIKIERPGAGDDTRGNGLHFENGESAYFLQQNWGKRSVALDLKHPEGMAVLRGLIGAADVLVENFRPGTLDRLGLGWKHLQELNPRLILCSISAFGQSGPEALRPGYGAMVEARAGIAEMTGECNGPPMPTPLPIADFLAASHAFGAVCAALVSRQRTGRGQHVDIALLDCAVEMHDWAVELHTASGGAIVPTRRGLRDRAIVPWGYFRTTDGWLCLIASNDSFWRKLAELIGQPELARHPDYATVRARAEHADEIYALLEQWVSSRSSRECIAILDAADIPAERLQRIPDLLDDPQIRHRGMIPEVDHPRLGRTRIVNTAVRLASGPAHIGRVAPLLGEHTREVLAELGYGERDIDRLETSGAVQSHR